MPTPVEQWVEECAQLTHPKNIHWCDGSEAEYQRKITELTELTKEQAAYLGVDVAGPYKSDLYRY